MRARGGGGLRAHETRNLIVCGLCVLRSASARKESRGLHYVLDFPERVEAERKPTLVEPRATDVYGRAPAVSLVAFAKVGDQAGEIRAASAPAR
jgi:succinate dehydrogenase/fumarate reductase flavoprotein subunit